MDELKGKTPEELRGIVEYLDAGLSSLTTDEAGAVRTLDDAEQASFDAGLAMRKAAHALYSQSQTVAALAELPAHTERTFSAPNVRTSNRSVMDVAQDRSASPAELTDAITRSVEARAGDEIAGAVRGHLTRHLSGKRVKPEVAEWARAIAVRSTDTYAEAFGEYLRSGVMGDYTAEERTTLSVGTSADGGYLVPTHLDPSLIVTNDGDSGVVRGLAHKVTLVTGNVWHGVTTAGASFSVDAELAEVSDDSPSFGSVSIPTYKMQGFIQASIEATQDTGLVGELGGIFADGKSRLEETKFTTGAGSTEPKGLFTAVHAVSGDRVVSGTAATIALADLHALYLALPVRWRSKGVFLSNPKWAMAVKTLGTALSASYSTDLTQPPTDQLLGHRYVQSDDAPGVATTTALDDELLFGDLSQFYIVDMPGGFAIEYIPHLFNTSNNRPDGRRGWYSHWRAGSDVVNTAAFRVLVDKTSA